jgi:hypothetical protein
MWMQYMKGCGCVSLFWVSNVDTPIVGYLRLYFFNSKFVYILCVMKGKMVQTLIPQILLYVFNNWNALTFEYKM